MTNADRLLQLNRWYDDVPDLWQTHIITWPLVGAGTVNVLLSMNTGFPFGLLVLLTIAGFAAIRLPPQLGWIKPGPDGARFDFGRFDLLHDLNELYDSIPELPRFAIFPLFLIGCGTLSMWLTWHHGWPFGSLLLVGIAAILAFRVPYVWKLFTPPPARQRGLAMVQAWTSGASAWWSGLTAQTRSWTLAMAIGVILAFDLIVTGGGRTGLSLLLALELFVAIVIDALGKIERSSVGSATTLREQWAVLETLWKRPGGWGYSHAMTEHARSRSRLTMEPPAHSQTASADD